MQGTGTLVNANFTNVGEIAPGAAIGVFNVTGNFRNDGMISIDLGGLTGGTQYDQLAVTGNVVLDGRLKISTVNGFSPAIGQSFTIVSGATITGSFTTIDWPAGVTGTVTYLANSVRVDITSTLPLTLLSFTGRLEAGSVQLTWKTADEMNTSHFEVQRSTNGTSFTPIATVQAAGSGSSVYNMADHSPTPGNNYYRLKMIDRDAKFTYSRTVLIKTGVAKGFSVSPVPASSYINITVTDELLIGKYAGIYDNTGKKVADIRLERHNPVHISGWSQGIYVIRTEGGKGLQFVKQ